ncbi:AAA family ATPase, partial [Escherichia coli]|nr:AAA family ATPase [Escherichia coli]
ELEENYLDVFKVEHPESKTVTSSIYFYLQKLCNDDELKSLESGNYDYLNFEKNESQTITEETVEESALLPKLTHVPYD